MIGLRNFEGMTMLCVGWKKKPVIQIIPSNELLVTCGSEEEMKYFQKLFWKYGVQNSQQFLYQRQLMRKNKTLVSPMSSPLDLDWVGYLSVDWKNQDLVMNILRKEELYIMRSWKPRRYIMR